MGWKLTYNKHKNIRSYVDGYDFASKKEAKRYAELKLLEKGKVISNLIVHPAFILSINNTHICNYIADFSYIENGKEVIEDVKGYKKGGAYQLFRLKKKLMYAIYVIDILELWIINLVQKKPNVK